MLLLPKTLALARRLRRFCYVEKLDPLLVCERVSGIEKKARLDLRGLAVEQQARLYPIGRLLRLAGLRSTVYACFVLQSGVLPKSFKTLVDAPCFSKKFATSSLPFIRA